MPYADFARSAVVLDNVRLGKQRVETLQIMQVLTRLRWDNNSGVIEAFEPKGWRTHPVVLMWRGFAGALMGYQSAVCSEWAERGFTDTCAVKTAGLLAESGFPTAATPPPWLGEPALHLSHRSNLVRKDPRLYGPRFVGVPADLPYVWPVEPPSAATRPR